MTKQQAKQLLENTAKALNDGDQTFCLILRTGKKFYVIDGRDDDIRCLSDLTVCRIYANSWNIGVDFSYKETEKLTISGNVKSISNTKFVLQDQNGTYDVRFINVVDNYRQDKIQVGDYLELRVIVNPPVALYANNSPVGVIPTFDVESYDDILIHTRTLKG